MRRGAVGRPKLFWNFVPLVLKTRKSNNSKLNWCSINFLRSFCVVSLSCADVGGVYGELFEGYGEDVVEEGVDRGRVGADATEDVLDVVGGADLNVYF